MCGITGFWSQNKQIDGLALQMAESINTRGPDDMGDWYSRDGTLAIAHRRLSIIDVSSAGHQPMATNCGQHIIVFNGEIYNHEDLRKELDSTVGRFHWRGHSDTEVLLNCLFHWGVEVTLSKLNGMFAFAYYSAENKSLFLARDRMGEKPLYYGHHNGTFLFGSELKSLRVHPSFSAEIDRDALALYARYNYIPDPFSIYRNTYKLNPAHYLVIRDCGKNISEQICYWDLNEVAKNGIANQIENESQALEDLENLLKDSVKRRMISDVPLGAFLSGGYDSTTIAALMQAQSNNPVKTFSIGFREDVFNEAQFAKRVAAHLGTEHTELYIEPKQALAVIPKMPVVYDEPFSDPSQIPTFLVSQLAREHVKVALSGDGGDELFCGYNRYNLGMGLWEKFKFLPPSIRSVLALLFGIAPSKQINCLQRLLPKRYRVQNLPDRLLKLKEMLVHNSGEKFYQALVSTHKQPESIVLGCTEPLSVHDSYAHEQFDDLRNWMMCVDMLSYLPGDILTKVDRASMSLSLEARVPLLDHRLVEYAWRLPIEMKVKHGEGKWPLRQVLYKYVPKEMMERPKQGFGVPIEHWLRGPLKLWAEELLNESRLIDYGFFDPKPISKMWNEHLSGQRRWHSRLWNILMFQAWFAEQ